MKKRYPHKNNVLLVNITRLGDMLQATPTIAGIKEENPNCQITVLVEKQFESICFSIPHVDEVISLDLGMTVRSLAREQDGIVDAYEYVDEMVADLKERGFDYCMNMSSSAYTALLLRLVDVKQNGGWISDDTGCRIIESDWARLFATSVFHQNRQFNSLNLVDVFRCSADVEKHPHHLVLNVDDDAREYCRQFVEEAGFTNSGPLITLQAGASQVKRQWAPEKFIEFISMLINDHNARIVLSGSKKELPLLEIVKAGCASPNVAMAAGRTNIPQLAALLELSEILVTGDTGPMHVSVAVGTPVIAMFLASAYGYETGPYSEGNIVLQPVIGCAPCNPNKPCTRPNCHDAITPELLVQLTVMRLKEDFTSLPGDLADPSHLIIYRSCFDEYGFCDLVPLNCREGDSFTRSRRAYRKLWLDDLGGYQMSPPASSSPSQTTPLAAGESLGGLQEVLACAEQGEVLISKLIQLVEDVHSPAEALGLTNQQLEELDRQIEQIGYHFAAMAPITRMFAFAKENILGSDALDLASQMRKVYQDLSRRGQKLGQYYHSMA